VDLQYAPITYIKDQSFYQVTKYLLDEPIAPANDTWGFVNLDRFNKLPADIQKLLTQTWADFDPQFEQFQLEQASLSRKLGTDNKMTFVKFSADDEKKFFDIIKQTSGTWSKPRCRPKLIPSCSNFRLKNSWLGFSGELRFGRQDATRF